MLLDAVLTYVATKVFDTIIDNLTTDAQDKIKSLLKADPAELAFKQSLAKAIKRYAKNERIVYAEALTRDGGVLFDKDVIAELSKLISPNRVWPDTSLIGKWWRDALDSPPSWIDFAKEADRFLHNLEDELKSTDVFRPFFDSRNLEDISKYTQLSAETLQSLERQITEMHDLFQDFRIYLNQLIRENDKLSDEIIDQLSYIREKTTEFVGRQFVFDAIQNFITSNPQGYFVITGDPGIGKSAISAQLVKQHGYIHHFNIRAEGINKPSDFLRNICAQLITVYDLEHTELPARTTENGGVLKQLLEEVSEKLGDKKCVIVVDALDEVDMQGTALNTNVLYLPKKLPEGVFFILTKRREKLTLGFIFEEYPIKQDDNDNTADIQEFVETQIPLEIVQQYIQQNGIDNQTFIEQLVKKSQGNFIYLRLVVNGIKQGRYRDLAFKELPVGLTGYYDEHWRRIQQENGLDWFDYRLPVVLALTIIDKPVSIHFIMTCSGVSSRKHVRGVLNDFDQFLYCREIEYDQEITDCYRWYHQSFFDFIGEKQVVAEERVDLQKSAGRCSDGVLGELLGDL